MDGLKISNPIQLSPEIQEMCRSVMNPQFVIGSGGPGVGKSFLLNNLINPEGDEKLPFKVGGGTRGLTRGIPAFGPIHLDDFCSRHYINNPIAEDCNLIFVDTEGRDALDGDLNLDKALVIASSIADVRLAVWAHRPTRHVDKYLRSEIQLRSLAIAHPVVSSFALVFTHCGPPGQLDTAEEFEEARREQNVELFNAYNAKFPGDFNPDNSFVTSQPSPCSP
jgi:hypothetical protein